MYREVKNKETGDLVCITRIEDGATIPLDERNTDYASYSAWVAQGNTPEPDPYYSVEALRARKWEELKTQRDSRSEGGVQVNGRWYHTDSASRIKWMGTKDTARDILDAGGTMSDPVPILGQQIKWKTMSGDFVSVTVQLAFDVVEANKALDATLFAQCEAKRQALYQSPTPETFDTASGWNQTYTEATASV